MWLLQPTPHLCYAVLWWFLRSMEKERSYTVLVIFDEDENQSTENQSTENQSTENQSTQNQSR